MMQIGADALHERLSNLFKRFHQICQDNGIIYYMLGGTCLGAARHGGFIPWDDDIDVGIPRDHYNAFIKLSEEALGPDVELRFYANTDQSPFHYVKFIDSSTTLVEKNYHNYVEGLYIDVFPLDTVPKGLLARKAMFMKAHALQSLIVNHCVTDCPSDFIRSLYREFARHLDIGLLHRKLELVMTSYQGQTTGYVGNLLGAWQMREITTTNVFGEPTLYRFEDTEFFGPQDCETYLSELYGDWRELPPLEKRVFRHDYYYVNLDLPYRLYLANNRQDHLES